MSKTLEELRAHIAQMKISTFNDIRTARNIDPRHTGHKSIEHRAHEMIESTAKQIEKLIQQWEKDNPDS